MSDEGERRLERAATQGCEASAEALRAARARRGACGSCGAEGRSGWGSGCRECAEAERRFVAGETDHEHARLDAEEEARAEEAALAARFKGADADRLRRWGAA